MVKSQGYSSSIYLYMCVCVCVCVCVSLCVFVRAHACVYVTILYFLSCTSYFRKLYMLLTLDYIHVAGIQVQKERY
jgi:hypothetical protein